MHSALEAALYKCNVVKMINSDPIFKILTNYFVLLFYQLLRKECYKSQLALCICLFLSLVL